MEIQQQFLGVHNDRHRSTRTGQFQTIKNPANAELFKLCYIKHMKVRFKLMAEREGFEPSIWFPIYTRSRRAPSTTRPPLQKFALYPERNNVQV